ncbi:hypothetical protein OIU84_002661 [Salix udensis]|uniref:Uncharacterized protein n=1 Tax=Salix udensis TaxID=889485 RepID=A0AAD6K546_9ROSI|nr:hypothetical protein OIU84_002661 [Salix udensis]
MVENRRGGAGIRCHEHLLEGCYALCSARRRRLRWGCAGFKNGCCGVTVRRREVVVADDYAAGHVAAPVEAFGLEVVVDRQGWPELEKGTRKENGQATRRVGRQLEGVTT